MMHKNLINYFLLLLLLSNPLLTFSQNSLEQQKNEFYKNIKLLNLKPEGLLLNNTLNRINRDSLSTYYQEILSSYQEQKEKLNKEQNIYYLYEIGFIQTNLGYLDLAKNSFENAIKYTDKIKYSVVYVRLNLDLGNAYRNSGMKQKSNEILLSILDSPILLADSAQRIFCLGLVAENYENLNDFELAMETIMILFDYHLRKDDLAKASYNLIQLGRSASYLETDTSYFEYFHQANKMALKSNNKARIENNLVNTAKTYRKAGYPKIALRYLIKTEEYAQNNSAYGLAYTLYEFSSTYLTLDSAMKALQYAKRTMAVANEINAYNWLYHANKIMAGSYMKMNKLDSARYCLNNAVRLNKMLNNKSYAIDLYKQLYEVSLNLQDYPLAISYLDSSYSAYTIYVSEQNDDKLAQLRMESDYYIHRNKIAELVSNNEIEKEKSKKLIAIILGVLVVLILTFYFTLLIRRRLKQLKESYFNLVKKNIELDKLNSKLHACETTPKRKIKLENIKDEDALIKKLNMLLIEEEAFTNPDLSLKSLADVLDTNTSYLSAAVNSHFNCNLPTLINQHRIDKARRILVSDEFNPYSMEGIALEVGFKSRSVFYQAFKTITGLSPSIYIENYKLVVSL